MDKDSNKGVPGLAVLIVTYNSAADILRCIRSLEKPLMAIPHEICVIDNGSADLSAALVSQNFPTVKVIPNALNRGFAAAINLGIKATSAPYLFWMNPDSELAQGDITAVLNYFRDNPKTGILGLKIINPNGSLQLSARSFPSYSTAFFNRYSLLSRLFPKNPFTQKYLGTDWDHNQIREVDWVSGAGLLHRRDLIEKIGFLDETFFMYCEDVDFCFRASQAGWKVIYHPGLTLRHAIGGSSKSLPLRMIRERHRSIWHYYKKHFKRNALKDFFIATGLAFRRGGMMVSAYVKKLCS